MSGRISTGLCGLLAIDKPTGPTSHDIVARVRRFTGERRVGHGGTLDPLASGLLIVAVGPATRLTKFFIGAAKSYRATIVFGTETDTDDAEGTVTVTADIPPEITDPARAEAFLVSTLGEQSQTPPDYSAVKVAGQKAYDVARKGGSPGLPPRTIEVRRADLKRVTRDPDVSWEVDLEVSKGTYIRALARDWGRQLGSGAHIGALRRTTLGVISVEAASSIEAIESSTAPIADLFLPIPDALAIPTFELTAEQAAYVKNGRPLTAVAPAAAGPVAVVSDGEVLGIYSAEADMLVPDVVIPGGCR